MKTEVMEEKRHWSEGTKLRLERISSDDLLHSKVTALSIYFRDVKNVYLKCSYHKEIKM